MPDVDAAVARAVRRFGEITRRAYDDLTPRAEALAFAKRMGGAASVYVVSGSDQVELRAIFDEHRIGDRFASVLGSPTRKAEHMRQVLARHGVPASDAIMVGDGSGDHNAARAVGVPFVLLREMSTWSQWSSEIDSSVRVADTWAALIAMTLEGD